MIAKPSYGRSGPGSYGAYGLVVRCPFDLWPLPPKLAGSASHPDDAVHIRLGETGHAPADTDPECLVTICRDTQVIVRQGAEITINPREGASVEELRIAAMQGVAGVLQQRGQLVLHGSAVEIDGKAALLLAGRGTGKSTTAAYLHHRSRHPLICDDLAPVRLADDTIDVLSGHPASKLWPDALRSLGHEPDQLHPVLPRGRKRILPALSISSQSDVPLGAIFMLERGGAPGRVARLAPGDAFEGLLRFGFGAWLLPDAASRATHLERCCALLERTTCWSLRTGNTPRALDAICAGVEHHLGRRADRAAARAAATWPSTSPSTR